MFDAASWCVHCEQAGSRETLKNIGGRDSVVRGVWFVGKGVRMGMI